jgi:hypothetical protein
MPKPISRQTASTASVKQNVAAPARPPRTPTPAAPPRTADAGPTFSLSDPTVRRTTTYGAHLDGYDTTTRSPYGLRLGEDLRTSPRPDVTTIRPEALPVPVPAHHAEPTVSPMARAIESFPLAHAIPDMTIMPTIPFSTSPALDGTPEGRATRARAEESRPDVRGRPTPVIPTPSSPDRAAEEADQAVRESIARAVFCASPAGDSSPLCD